MKVVAFLPAKGSSERILSKNLQLLDGKPLFLHTLEKLLECDFLDEVILDSESDEIIKYAADLKCKILRRDERLASNDTDGNKLFMNEVNFVDADIYVQILCTSPFIEKDTIKKGINILKEKKQYDSVILASKQKLYTWKENKPNYNINQIPNSSTLEDTIIESMGLYIIRKEAARNTKRRIGNNPYFLYGSPLETIDVNFPEDFELANLIAAGQREKERKLLQNIGLHLTSSILSDILDDLGIQDSIISDLSLNLPRKKIFGTAKTLKLRKLLPNENYDGIYQALNSYKTIVPNDVIVVQNDAHEYAYFGELNANLAIRAGAIGAIIGGKTRDSNSVKELSFPVFSKGNYCKDVRGRATLEAINKKVIVSGVEIEKGDLIFGDNEGIVVIKKKLKDLVVNHAFKVIGKEKEILLEIANGIDIDSLTRKFGYF